jgi:hypothetical protein
MDKVKMRKNMKGMKLREKSVPGINRRRISANTRAAKFAELKAKYPEKTNTALRLEAGYKSGKGETPAAALPLLQDMRARIEAAQIEAGFFAVDSLKRLKGIRDKGEDKDSITAIKVAHEITGERMPERIDMSVKQDDALLTMLLGSQVVD